MNEDEGVGALKSGVATFTTSSLAVGTQAITAAFSGDTANAPSTSPPLQQVVDAFVITGHAESIPTLADAMIALQAQIIAFSHDYQLVMIFILCSIPLALMIGSSKAALRKQSAGPEHAVME